MLLSLFTIDVCPRQCSLMYFHFYLYTSVRLRKVSLLKQYMVVLGFFSIDVTHTNTKEGPKRLKCLDGYMHPCPPYIVTINPPNEVSNLCYHISISVLIILEKKYLKKSILCRNKPEKHMNNKEWIFIQALCPYVLC